MTNPLKHNAKLLRDVLIENQTESKARGSRSMSCLTPRGGVAVEDLSPLSPTPFMILALPGGPK